MFFYSRVSTQINSNQSKSDLFCCVSSCTNLKKKHNIYHCVTQHVCFFQSNVSNQTWMRPLLVTRIYDTTCYSQSQSIQMWQQSSPKKWFTVVYFRNLSLYIISVVHNNPVKKCSIWCQKNFYSTVSGQNAVISTLWFTFSSIHIW